MERKTKSIIPLVITIPVGVTIPVGGTIPLGRTHLHECKRMGVPTARLASQGKGTDTSECSS